MIKVIERDGKVRLPFSRGILTRSITSVGVDVDLAYAIATEVQEELIRQGKKVVTKEEIRNITYQKLVEKGFKEEAKRYLFWRRFRKLKIPLIILLGGPTGVGKSTIATELAFRLGIRSVIGTDTIREVMRKIITPELLPTIHTSTFLAWKELRGTVTGSPIIAGFESQVNAVAVGVNAVIQRAIKEGLNAIIEGIHLVPGFIKIDYEMAFMYMIVARSREELEARFYERTRYSKRSAQYYISHLDEIMEIQEYLIKKAREYRVPIIENVELEKTISTIMEDIMEKTVEIMKKKGLDMLEEPK
ncbi:2-phosphoglycerate kinase [Pyrococcus furiosus DSM 3638]|uniref:2-phosphoglycerate kinase n=3 Tax=Pyrococcus furiosus TaxID=2261 RepID=PGK2_PYRFU|nr:MULTISPECIES: 2-phosphoglycerate kinase [Pyrococcus]Q8U4K7.1 RecName: Full=2-phosphoglycerate kinase; Short=2PGK [Pyrococcus furiosus DSM 3638]AAL80202.1 2-phosphoglycerate kinase [Pyrococcus furiosus DSM 3638]AFN04496.1 2-phosphoglycerate kinase [Pyrococcus furiosus COM1]MDK2870318.1 2-phosphoglycerate kinase [Pyrococcus sp.]QEK77812.1 2-phosphoglycerate kinase [Pyrococcus furiosus DSM 3638]